MDRGPRRRSVAAALAAIVLSLAAVCTAATPLTIREAGLALTVPTGWNAATEGTRYLVTSPNGDVIIVFTVIEAAGVDAALASVRKSQARQLANVRTEGRSETRVAGLEIVEEHGTATTPDGLTAWRLGVIRAARPVIVYTIGSPAALRQHEREYEQLQQSFHRS